LWAHYQGGDVDAGLAELKAPAKTLIDDLLWWTAALKTARQRGLTAAAADGFFGQRLPKTTTI